MGKIEAVGWLVGENFYPNKESADGYSRTFGYGDDPVPVCRQSETDAMALEIERLTFLADGLRASLVATRADYIDYRSIAEAEAARLRKHVPVALRGEG